MQNIQINKVAKRTNNIRAHIVFFIAAFVVVSFIWLPFGFSLIGVIEEWLILGDFNNDGLYFMVSPSGPLKAIAARPLTLLPFALAYYLDANSFNYWHVLLILALLTKGGAASQLIWKTTGSYKWAIVTGALILLYPADTMQLSFRSLHINLALALILLASSFFMVAYEENRRLIACTLAMVAMTLTFVAICMYEASLLLVPLPILLFYAKEGLIASWQLIRSKLWLFLTWLIAPALYVTYFIWVSHKIASYESKLVGTGLFASLVNALPNLFEIGVLRSILGGWFDAIRIVLTEYSSYTYLIITTLIVMTVIFISKQLKRDDALVNDTYQPLRLAFAGLLLLMLGYAPFLLSPSHLSISQRTFLFASPGAAIMLVAVLICIAKFAKWLSWSLIAAFIFFGLGTQLYQFHHYIQLGEQQRHTLKSIIENVDVKNGAKTIVIRDESNMLGHTWMLIAESLDRTLSYFYDQKIKAVQVCHLPSGEWVHRDNLARPGKCIDEKDAWVFQAPEPVTGPGYVTSVKPKDIRLAKNEVVTVYINSDGQVSPNSENYTFQDRLHTDTTPMAIRYREILAKKPWPLNLVRFNDQIVPDYYKWSFGKWWSLEIPERGSGWRGAEWQVHKFYHQASSWKSQGNSSLYFEFLPNVSQHVLRGEFSYFVSDHIRNSTQIKINQIDIPIQWLVDNKFQAVVPQGVMRSGLNRIDFNSDIDTKYYGLSSKLAWFEIAAH